MPLDDVYRAVRDDGRREDDIILLGDLNTDDGHLGELGQMPYLVTAISKQPSNTRGNKLYDNIIFDRRDDRIHRPLGRAEPDT